MPQLTDAKSGSVQGLSMEEKIRLSEARPGTLAAAKRLEGITPVGILELIRYSRKGQTLLGK
jgi:tRNA uridine 5-carboxymethylaminomethyl modification enzyme